MGPNLFVRLHKWANRQDENFTTESLAWFLEHLCEHEPAIFVALLKSLTYEFLDVGVGDADKVKLDTQVRGEEGIPDIEIRFNDRLVRIEVKVGSPVRVGQLERYKMKPEHTGRLILLTRYPVDSSVTRAQDFVHIRWHQIATWIEDVHVDATNPISKFFCEQFLEFLKERNMTLSKVSADMPAGVRALRNFLFMLYEAAVSCKLRPNIQQKWGKGIGLWLDGRKYWIGLTLDTPGELVFSTFCQIDREAAARLGVGEVDKLQWAAGGYAWGRGAKLDSEEVHFFSRDKNDQMRWLEDFIRDCVEKARSIETADQPPIPKEPEDS